MTGVATRRVLLTSPVFWEVTGAPTAVFLAPPTQLSERLRPLGSLAPGELIGGLPPTTSGHEQVAITSSDTILRELTERELLALPDAATALAPWLTALLAVGHQPPAPRAFVSGRSGSSVGVLAGQNLRPVDELSLVEVRSGRLLAPGGWVVAEHGYVLLRAEDWVTASVDSDVVVLALADALRTSGGVERVRAAAADAVTRAHDRLVALDVAEAARRRRRSELDARVASLPDQLLEALLDDQASLLHPAADDDLVTVTRLVADAAGVELRTPAVRPPGTPTVATLARAARVRTRPVRLEGSWWSHGPEPMVGQLCDGGGPVALIPRAGGVDLVRPDGRRTRVTSESASVLEPEGAVLARSFPEGALTGRQLARFAGRGTGGQALLMLVTGLGVAGLGLLVPLLTGTILGTLVPRGDTALITDLCLLLLAAAAASALLSVSQNLVLLSLQGRLDATLQAAVWDRLMSLPGSFFRERTVGALASSVLSVTAIREVLAASGVQTAFAFIIALANIALIFFFSVPLAMVTVMSVLVAVLVAGVANIAQVRRQRTVFAASQELNASTFELVRGVSKIRMAAAEDRALGRWGPIFSRQRHASYRARVVQNRLTVFNSALSLAATMCLFVVASVALDVEVPQFLIVYTAFAQVVGSAVVISNTIASMTAVIPYVESLGPIVRAQPEVTTTQADPGELAGEVEVHLASFRYQGDGPLVLEDVSFRAAPGEFVAVVGPSGSGKSTILRLLLGFESPESGSVLYDGRDLSGLDIGAVRRQCGVVLQDGELMAGDLASNIAGSGTYTEAEILEAVARAGLEQDLAAMPLGLSTIVSEGAATLSGGQRQRVMIARALIGRPRVLFFDEATSALDNRTQSVVTRSTRALNATRIVIAHRLSTVEQADRVVVIDHGRVVQCGSPADLMGQDGLFRSMAARQTL